MIKFVLFSDVHLSGKNHRLSRAPDALRDVDVLLIAGDIANGGEKGPYALAREAFSEYPDSVPVFIVAGNHDISGDDEAAFRAYELDMLKRYEACST